MRKLKSLTTELKKLVAKHNILSAKIFNIKSLHYIFHDVRVRGTVKIQDTFFFKALVHSNIKRMDNCSNLN